MFEESLYDRKPDFTRRWFAEGERCLVTRWVFLRALGGIFFSAFYALYFQIHGLIGPQGILPAGAYLRTVREVLGGRGFWYVPSLLWLGSGDIALSVLVWSGVAASILLMVNVWPRVAIAVAGVCFLSFVCTAQDFSAYQSDGMLLEAALLSLFFAPPGIRPGMGRAHPPTRAARFVLQWEWFRIYFESGLVKILSGEEQWRNLTAMDKYYENGPLPTWLGWYAQQRLPHGFHAFTAGLTLVVELFVVWMLFMPHPLRRICFVVTTLLQVGIILTANYAFLNYLVLFLGVLLLDDDAFRPFVPPPQGRRPDEGQPDETRRAQLVVLPLFFAASVLLFLSPALLNAIGQFRIVNNYGLFAVMTRARYEIEFQGSGDRVRWTAYRFAYKPQDPTEAPRFFAPYQPRLDWNLWFASLGTVEDNRWVMNTQVRLLEGSRPVLRLFAGDPFGGKPPSAVRTVVWQYWFTTPAERARSGAWWNRRRVGSYSLTAVRTADGSITFE